MDLSLISKPLLSVIGSVGGCCSIVIPTTSNFSQQSYLESSNQETLLFDELWNKVSSDYTAKQKQNPIKQLPGKEKLQPILKANETGELKTSQGADCQDHNKNKEMNCGYLELKSSSSNYKIKVIFRPYETGGSVFVVKKQNDNQTTYFYDFDKGETNNNLQFEKLQAFESGTSVTGTAFTYKTN